MTIQLLLFSGTAILLPYNYSLMQNPRYAGDLNELAGMCTKRNVAVQPTKSIAWRPWGGHPKTYNTYFYEPLDTQGAIDKLLHWSLGLPDSFLITAGDYAASAQDPGCRQSFQETTIRYGNERYG